MPIVATIASASDTATMATTASSPNQQSTSHLNKNLWAELWGSTSLHVSTYEISCRIRWLSPHFSLVLPLPLRTATYVLFFSAIRRFQWKWTPVGMRVLPVFPFFSTSIWSYIMFIALWSDIRLLRPRILWPPLAPDRGNIKHCHIPSRVACCVLANRIPPGLAKRFFTRYLNDMSLVCAAVHMKHNKLCGF
jgi:hypothetical protein